MNFILIFFLLAGALFATSSQRKERNVASLSPFALQNMATYIEHDQSVRWAVILAYLPWNKELTVATNNLDRIANLFVGEPIYFGEVNVEHNIKLAMDLGMKSFPSVFIFNFETEEIEIYEGTRRFAFYAKWIEDKTGIDHN